MTDLRVINELGCICRNTRDGHCKNLATHIEKKENMHSSAHFNTSTRYKITVQQILVHGENKQKVRGKVAGRGPWFLPSRWATYRATSRRAEREKMFFNMFSTELWPVERLKPHELMLQPF